MDVACADGKLRPPMAGEWQDIAIAYACTVETVPETGSAYAYPRRY